MKHFTCLDWFLTRFAPSAIILHGVASLCGFALAQAFSSKEATHFSYDNKAALDVKEVSAAAQDRVTVRDVTYAGADGDSVPAYLIIVELRDYPLWAYRAN
jgi:hypothetical protein